MRPAVNTLLGMVLVAGACTGSVQTSSPCVPTTCAALGASCGTAADHCGGTLDCGGCDDSSGVCSSEDAVTAPAWERARPAIYPAPKARACSDPQRPSAAQRPTPAMSGALHGTSAACPEDSFAAGTVVCRATTGSCDVAELCTGISVTCPEDSFATATTVCRTTADTCDVAELCTGTAAACPDDSFAAAATVCRTTADTCDVAELCTGTSAACPADVSGCGPVRGTAGDRWADVVIGKPAFSEITPFEVVPYKLFNSGGIVVDHITSPPGSPGYAYVWDIGNSRILGFNLANVMPARALARPVSSSANLDKRILGLQRRQRLPGLPAEGGRLGQHALWDARGPDERVGIQCRRREPDGRRSGQPVCSGPQQQSGAALQQSLPIRARRRPGGDGGLGSDDHGREPMQPDWGIDSYMHPAPPPTADSLCTPIAVELDASGNMWVADFGNARVLRFPRAAGQIGKTADLVLGKSDFETGCLDCSGTGLDELSVRWQFALTPRAIFTSPSISTAASPSSRRRWSRE